MRPLAISVTCLALLAACTPTGQDEFTDGVVLLPADAEVYGIAENAIRTSDQVSNSDGTSTTTLQFVSAAVSDDEIAAAPALICAENQLNVLETEVRQPTAAEALGEGTLMMIVTCGA